MQWAVSSSDSKCRQFQFPIDSESYESINSDGASFGGVQAMTPFVTKFGAFSESKQAYYLPSRTASLMNSLPLLGKFMGTVIVGPIIEKIGHRRAMGITCFVQMVGAISEYLNSWNIQAKGLLIFRSSSDKQERCSVCYGPVLGIHSCGARRECQLPYVNLHA